MQQSYMKTKPVLPLVLSMSLPMMLSMLVASLYNIVDSYYVAKISEDAMTALSLVFPVQNLINAVTIGFAIGSNAVISYHLGAQQEQKASAAAAQSILCNAIHGILLTIVCTAAMPSSSPSSPATRRLWIWVSGTPGLPSGFPLSLPSRCRWKRSSRRPAR